VLNKQRYTTYYSKNRSKILQRQKQARLKNIDKYRERGRRWYAQNRESGLHHRLKRDYGLSLEGYKALLNKQCDSCAICGKKNMEHNKRLDVDHNHQTGYVHKVTDAFRANTICVNSVVAQS